MAAPRGIFGGDDVDNRITDAVFELMKTTDIPRIRVGDVLRLVAATLNRLYYSPFFVDDATPNSHPPIII